MNDKPSAFSCRNFSWPLHDCELRYVHQIIFKTHLLLWKMHSGTNELPWRQRVLIIVEALSDAPCPRFLYSQTCGIQEDPVRRVLPSFFFASCFIALQTLPDHLNIWIKAYLPYCTCGWHSSCIRQAGFTPSSWPSILSCASNAKQSKFFVPTLESKIISWVI